MLEHLTSLNFDASKYELKNIYNMDETPLYIDMPADKTIERIGEKSIDIISSGHDKHRVSCVLTISPHGNITKSFIIMQKLDKVRLSKVAAQSAHRSFRLI